MNDVFISYAREDRDFVNDLASALIAAGFSVWHDKHLHRVGTFDAEIVENLLQSHGLIAVVTGNSLESDWCKFEWALAARTGKEILVLRDESTADKTKIPKFLSGIMWNRLSEIDLNDIVSSVGEMKLFPRIWSSLSQSCICICLPDELFSKEHDEVISEVEAVNLTTARVAFTLQQTLLKNLGFHVRRHGGVEDDSVAVEFLKDDTRRLRPGRNYLILGGPGGVPFVQTLLCQWTGLAPDDSLSSGYRFVVDRRRAFTYGPFLRAGDQIGIEDVRDGEPERLFEHRQPSWAAAGKSQAVIYTSGLNRAKAGLDKIIICAALSRHTLKATVDFLLDRPRNNPWLENVEALGPCTETLLEFDVAYGMDPVIREGYNPRTLGA